MAYSDPLRCPDDETLASFVDRHLDEATRELVITHAADCRSCRFVLGSSGVEAVPAPRRVAAPWKALAAAAALALTGGLTWWGVTTRGPSVEDVLAATGTHRSTPARLSRAPFQPLEPTYRSAPERGVASPSAWRLAAEARDALAAVERHRTPEALQALGAAHLALGNRDEAVALFEEVASASAGVDHQVDLAAALIARGLRDDEPVDLVRAMELLAAALEREPRNAAALFDRALAIEGLAIPGQAVAAWEDYLEVDASSGWADEARAHLEALRRKQDEGRTIEGSAGGTAPPDEGSGGPGALATWASQHPGRALRWVRSALLSEWSGHCARGDGTAAEQALHRGLVAARAAAARSGESSLAETLDAALRDPARCGAAATLHARYGRAWKALEELASQQAADAFAELGDDSAALGAGEAEWASVGGLAAAVQIGAQPALVRDRLTVALAQTQRPLVRAQLLWLRGLLALRQGHQDAAIADLSAASPLLRDAGMVDDAAWLRFLEGEALRTAGDISGGWRVRIEAVRLARHSFRFASTLLGSATDASLEGWPAAALAFHEEGIRLLDRTQSTPELLEAWLWRAHILHQGGHAQQARRALEALAPLVAAVEQQDPSLGDNVRARYELTRALIGGGAPREDLRLVDVALPALRQHLGVYTPMLRQRRAELLLASGQTGSARAELASLIDDASRHRLEPAQELWSDGLDVGRTAVETALAIDIDTRHDPLAALRTLLAYRMASLGPQDDALLALRRSLQDDEVAVVYAPVGRSVVAWQIDARRSSWARIPAPADGIEAAIGRWVAQLDKPQGREMGRDLGRMLLPFFSDGVLPARLRIVPDEVLAGVPWAALPSPTDGTPLVSGTELTVAPFGVVRSRERETGAVLVVADARAAQQLDPLGGARSEAGSLQTLFPDAAVLIGDNARRDRVLAELPRASIAHFGVHAWANARHAALARLSLAPGPDGRSWLQAHEIADLRLPATSLVVLAGCSTARSSRASGAAASGLAQAFMAAGVPRVLGSLWDVEDAPTSDLFRAFYGAIADGASPEAALRRAQTELSRAGTPAGTWASFILLRG